MNRRNLILSIQFFLVSCVLIPLIFGCSSDRVRYDDLLGRWDILHAERNGRETQTLQNVYFEFSEDDKMISNLFGTEDTFKIDYHYPDINPKESGFSELMIIGLSGDTLEIRSRIGDFRYDFDLLKS